jgi:hypothetical protein
MRCVHHAELAEALEFEICFYSLNCLMINLATFVYNFQVVTDDLEVLKSTSVGSA